MFGRMKQNFREKTGRAQATKLPGNLENEMKYYTEWEKRDKNMYKAIGEIIDSFQKCKKRQEMIASLEELEKVFEGAVSDGAKSLHGFLRERMETEKEAYEKVTAAFKTRCETFASADLRSVTDACSSLKKKRLNRDGAERDYEKKQTEEKKTKFDAAEAEFQSAIKQVEAFAARIPEWDAQHARYYTEAMQALAEAFKVDGR